MNINLTEIIGPAFYEMYHIVMKEIYTHYWLKGGRGSLKSSFIAVMIILKIMWDGNKGIMSNALVIRRVKDTLRESVFEQLVWAINMLGVSHLWNIPTGNVKLTYIPTGQVILFRGMDKPKKLKSTKVSKGWIKYVWYEEVDEIEGPDKIRTVNQSLLRGGENFLVFYSFNPPESARNWTNKEVITQRPDKVVHTSTYLQAPKKWLGKQFILEAETLKKDNETKYKHEFLGEVVGTGAEIFNNVVCMKMDQDKINTFDRTNRGLDFGYAADPLTYTENYYDKKHNDLYIFEEIYSAGLSNKTATDLIKEKNPLNKLVIADSAEPRTINEFRLLGVNVIPAKKGPDSVRNGVKWLQDLNHIYIDNERCPNAYREFSEYEREKDKNGEYKDEYPDKNNHCIDGVRYSLESYILNNKVKIKSKKSLF